MLDPNNHFAIFGAILLLSAAGFLLQKTRVGGHITGTVIVILLTIAAANLGLIPHDAPAYGFVFSYIVPMLIPLFLFQANIGRLIKEAPRTTLAFIIASAGTTAGALIAVSLVDVSSLAPAVPFEDGQREAAIAGLFASTYIGGSVNYAALGEITGLSGDTSFFSAATAADNLFSAVFLSILALIPATQWFINRFPSHEDRDVAEAEAAPITAQSICLSLAVSVTLVAISDFLVSHVDIAGARYVALTVLSLIIASAVPNIQTWLSGAFELGVALSFPFFAAIAAGADLVAMLSVAPILIAMVLILLGVHLAVLLSVGRLFKLSLPELVTASNAAILGATTAPALAAAKGWKDQITPGVLAGVIGYALGTFIGTAIYNFW